MELSLSACQPLAGDVVPVIFDFKTNKIAQPNTSLALPGKEVQWGCADWLSFHKGLVRFFQEGRFKSRIKYAQDKAIEQANSVFMQHWERNATFWSTLRSCGYGGEFFNYFKSVGLTETLNIFQSIVVPTTKATASVAQSAATTVEKTADAAGKTIVNAGEAVSNTTEYAKYIMPTLLVGGCVFTLAYIYKNYVKGDDRIHIGPAQV